jgi:hypothetical protein
MDDGHIGSAPTWVEIGLNASHMVGPHHVLFEGNYAFNWDSDKTHGNSVYQTVFRNHLSGKRRSFNDGGPRRCAGATYYSYWMSYVGNVLGLAGQMSGWVYESSSIDTPGIWLLGWDDWSPYPIDPRVKATAIRHGNFDYLTNAVAWDPANANHTLPPSLYLSQKPAFFNAGSGYVSHESGRVSGDANQPDVFLTSIREAFSREPDTGEERAGAGSVGGGCYGCAMACCDLATGEPSKGLDRLPMVAPRDKVELAAVPPPGLGRDGGALNPDHRVALAVPTTDRAGCGAVIRPASRESLQARMMVARLNPRGVA